MKKHLTVGFVTTFSGRWPQELPNKRNQEYYDWLEANLGDVNVVRASVLGNSKSSIEQIVDQFKKDSIDIIIMVYGAFTGDDISTYFTEMLNVPIVLWAPYEIPFKKDERLYANALVALTMNSASLRKLGFTSYAVYGDLGDDRATGRIKKLIAAYDTVHQLKNTNLGLLGYRPTAFYNSSFDETLIRKTFGIKIEETDLKVIFDKMDQMDQEVYETDMREMAGKYDVTKLPEGHLENHSKLYFALKEVIEEQGYDFSVIKCWPEMGSLHTTPCAVMGRLADENVNIGCEGDVDVEIAQIVQNYITGLPTFITDMINIDEDENLMTFWHCGNAAPSLADPKYPLELMNHPLAGQGTAFYGSLKSGKVTIARFCNIDNQYKLFLMKGEAISKERYTKGIMANVKVTAPVRDVVNNIIDAGVAHHYSLVWSDVSDEMKEVCKLLNIPVIEM